MVPFVRTYGARQEKVGARRKSCLRSGRTGHDGELLEELLADFAAPAGVQASMVIVAVPSAAGSRTGANIFGSKISANTAGIKRRFTHRFAALVAPSSLPSS